MAILPEQELHIGALRYVGFSQRHVLALFNLERFAVLEEPGISCVFFCFLESNLVFLLFLMRAVLVGFTVAQYRILPSPRPASWPFLNGVPRGTNLLTV